MGESGITVSQLLDVAADDVKDTLAEHMQEHSVHAGLPPTVLGFIAEETAQAIANQLKLDIFELIFKAWAAVDELREYTDPVKHPPGQSAVVRWGKCSIKAPQAVDVTFSVTGIALPVLRFTIDLAADFHSLALTIEGGAIRKLSPDPATASAALKYRSVTLIAERKTPELTFKRGIEFHEGLRIA